ncbi:MAG: right-handed parallel beta-helix repeat-containing protein, partial [Phycisphaerae bacterium]
VVARVEDDLGNRLGINSVISAIGFQDHPLQLLRGVGSVFLPAATEPDIISYVAEIQSLQTLKQITIEAFTTWQTVSEDITTSTDWGENARIHISSFSGDLLTIVSSATLTIGAGSVIIINPNIEIAVQGNVVVNGTMERPVVFTAQNRGVPWGGLLFESNLSRGELTGAIFTRSGADSKWFNNNPSHGHSHRKDQCLFYLSNGAHVTLTDCYLVENYGQAGHGENSYLTMTGCLVQKCTTIGQYNGGAVIIEDCALIEFPSATASYSDGDNDAIYLTNGTHSLTDCLIGWALDDGIDAGASSGGSVTVNNCWFESCYHEGMAWSGPKIICVNDTVILNCGQGIECGYDAPDVNAVHCLCTANLVGARFGDNYDWSYNGFLTVANSLLLFNKRDVWGRAWDNWTVHTSQMDIQRNYLSADNTNHPNNWIWDPEDNPIHRDQLQPFLSTPPDTVGIGLATIENIYDFSHVSSKIPVRLSTFTTSFISVDYSIDTEDGLHDSGSLQFIPGETVKHIQFEIPPAKDFKELRLTLSNPLNAELTGYRQITYMIP